MNTHTITLPILDMNSPHCATCVKKAITSAGVVSNSLRFKLAKLDK